MAKLNLHLPKLAVVTLETRIEYVDLPELEFLARTLREGQTPTELELAIGFFAVTLAAGNAVGGYFATVRMLDMFQIRKKDDKGAGA